MVEYSEHLYLDEVLGQIFFLQQGHIRGSGAVVNILINWGDNKNNPVIRGQQQGRGLHDTDSTLTHVEIYNHFKALQHAMALDIVSKLKYLQLDQSHGMLL